MANFRTRSRAVDLLGKQQIRDEVTAISELLRNSYDADASFGLIDVNSKKNRILIVDDGDGMTKDDLENKWLTLGTYSKMGTSDKPTKKGRIKIGEKGIGRLAISLLGNQLMLLSKSNITGNWILMFLHWDLFRNESVFLEQIDIPIHEFSSVTLLEEYILNRNYFLKNELLNNLENEHWVPEYKNQINNEVMSFTVEPDVLQHLRLLERRGSGTVFLISALDNSFDWEIYGSNSNVEEETGIIRKRRMKDLLFSFRNEIDILDDLSRKVDEKNEFIPRIHINGNKLEDENWFNEDKIKIYDYSLRGQIIQGKFYGDAEIRDLDGNIDKDAMTGIDLTQGITNPMRKDCGPIRLKLFFLEGRDNVSSVTKEQHHSMSEILNEIGGVYVYRDGLRILPYGEIGNDFLGIEKRRTQRAGTFLFSFRRMYGFLEISKKSNENLLDKSSREGFIENQYFNYFRTVVVNLLLWWARDYLGTKEAEGGRREQRNDELKKERDKRDFIKQKVEKEKKEENQYRKMFDRFIDSFERKYTTAKKQLQKEILNCFSESGYHVEDYQSVSSIIRRVRNHALQLIDSHTKELYFKLNNRYPLPNDALELFEINFALVKSLIDKQKQIVERQLLQLQGSLESQVQKYITKKNQQLQIEELKESTIAQVNHFLQYVAEQLPKPKGEIAKQITEGSKKRLSHLSHVIDEKIANLVDETKTDLYTRLGNINQELSALIMLRDTLRNFEERVPVEEIVSKIDTSLSQISRDMDSIGSEASNLFSELQESPKLNLLNQLLDEFEKRVIDDEFWNSDNALIGTLKSEVTMFRELSAVGLAAELTSHEFNALYQDIRRNLDLLIKASTSPKVNRLLTNTRDAFLSLERLHERMSPLYRQTRARKKDIELKSFVENVIEYFSNDLQRFGIKTVVDVPEGVFVHEAETILFTPLVNLLSNAMYWVLNHDTKEIHFFVDDESKCLYVQDTGSGIQEKDQHRIFEPYVSKREGGRGLGLFLSRNVLESKGHQIYLIPEPVKPRDLAGACFCIEFNEQSRGV